MTIKQRLYISHILMIIVPVILSIVVSSLTFFLVWHYYWGVDEGAMAKNTEFRVQYATVESLIRKWSGDEGTDKMIKHDVRHFKRTSLSDDIALFVYDGDELVASAGVVKDKKMKDVALREPGEHSYLKDETFLKSFYVNQYKVILVNSNYYNDLYYKDPLWDRDYQATLTWIIGAIVIGVIGVIILTSRYLTRYMLKSITQPLTLLTVGFEEIREGNLRYRIFYREEDEFLSVARDFNGMASQLKQMMDTQKKLEGSRRELIAGISHDLRTPLTSIKAYVEGLELEIANTPEMKAKYYEIIKKKIADLNQIIEQLFLFSKLDTNEFPFNIVKTSNKKLIDDYVTQIAAEYAEKGLTISLSVPDIDVLLAVDSVQFRTVLTNIFENARKYVPHKDKRVTVSYRMEKRYLILSIVDNGPGVAPENLENLFELFYRDDHARSNPSKGNGLGLAISKKIIEGFNGSICAHNQADGGLAIVIVLPIEGGDQ
ncbi:hypothetical protein A5886_000501 [Enterococcus sp. 8G7_MSG3316]|uniref:histidine kinase n=1 Tax=Candidatus Enterococcus testudinis TaxID=1834191 RepID=A0A242A3X2_9ENTE|nr:HAMP domain-containing sensor histidine kinase [Enterococcus sp. 8G7_MSG3316]OTN75431.1 hypothetical protein A5886_000501 [Enterococcus sp. 8G7_MSG3316]